MSVRHLKNGYKDYTDAMRVIADALNADPVLAMLWYGVVVMSFEEACEDHGVAKELCGPIAKSALRKFTDDMFGHKVIPNTPEIQ